MPDPTGKTLSATQTPALFNASPYITRWMLARHFIYGDVIDAEEDARMSWGKKLQPLLLAQAAEDFHLEVNPNPDDKYMRRGLIGCTRDGEIICPSRGPGSIETKCVFDYSVWMQAWDGGKNPPRHNEIQIQQQMLVGDGERSHEWGVLAVWVCGEMKYFERKPVEKFWRALETEATQFFADVRDKREGEPFGEPVEYDLLKEAFPVVTDTVIEVDDKKLVETAIQYRDAKEQEAAGKRTAENLRCKLIAAAKGAGDMMLPDDVRVRFRVSGPYKGLRIKVYVPGEGIPADLLAAG